MGTVPTPTTQVAGTVVPAATINSQGNLATYLAGRTESGGSRRPVAILRQTVAQSIPNNTTTAITFDTEDVDYDNGHSTVTNTSRYTFQTAGVYLLLYGAAFAANATGRRQAWLRINGGSTHLATRITVPATSSTDGAGLSGVGIVVASALDYVELAVAQASGGSLNTTAALPDECIMGVYLLSV